MFCGPARAGTDAVYLQLSMTIGSAVISDPEPFNYRDPLGCRQAVERFQGPLCRLAVQRRLIDADEASVQRLCHVGRTAASDERIEDRQADVRVSAPLSDGRGSRTR